MQSKTTYIPQEELPFFHRKQSSQYPLNMTGTDVAKANEDSKGRTSDMIGDAAPCKIRAEFMPEIQESSLWNEVEDSLLLEKRMDQANYR